MITSIYISKNILRYVNLEKQKERFSLLDIDEINTSKEFNLRKIGKDIYISYFYQDIRSVKISINKVVDSKTKELLIRNKLASTIGDASGYKLIYFFEKSDENEDTYNVYLIPENLIDKIKLENALKEQSEYVSLEQFSLLSLQNKLFGEGNIIHIYANEDHITIFLSVNGQLDYSRSINVPDYINTEEQLTNFFYENINVTYMYILQNKRINIDLILFSGMIYNFENLISMSFQLTQVPISCINHNYIIDNISPENFQKYIVAISNTYINNISYDIRPIRYIQNRNFSFLLKLNSYILLLLIAASSLILAKELREVKKLNDSIKVYETQIQEKREQLLRNINFPKEYVNYFLNYLEDIKNFKEKNGLLFLQEFKDLFKIYSFYFDMSIEDKTYQIKINTPIKFHSILEMEQFKGKLQNELNKLKRKGFTINDNTSYNLDNLKANINIQIKKEETNEPSF